jgi:hypothetical protein
VTEKGIIIENFSEIKHVSLAFDTQSNHFKKYFSGMQQEMTMSEFMRELTHFHVEPCGAFSASVRFIRLCRNGRW